MPRFTERGSLEPGVQWKATRPTAREGRLQLGPKRNQHPGKKPSTLSRPGASSRLRPLEGKTQAPGKASPSPNLGGPPVQGEPCLKRESGLAWPQPVSSPTIAPSCPQAGQPLALFMWLLKVQTLLCYVTILSSFREKLSNAVLFLFFFFHF